MDKIKQFIDNIASGDNVAAKNDLDELLSNKAFDALENYKKQMATSLFGGEEQQENEQENEVESSEDVAEEE